MPSTLRSYTAPSSPLPASPTPLVPPFPHVCTPTSTTTHLGFLAPPHPYSPTPTPRPPPQDTWTWQRLDPGPGPGALPGSAPEQPPRRDMASLTRAGADCLVLFGGRLESGRVAGDAWVLDLQT